MWLMAILTLHTNDPYMHIMLSNISNNPVTIQTMPPFGINAFMGFMTFVTIKLHWSILRNIYFHSFFDRFLFWSKIFDVYILNLYQYISDNLISMTEKAFTSLRTEIFRPVCMAIKAGQLFHPDAMDCLVLMAFNTESGIRQEFVDNITMAFGTFKLFYKYMLRMELRPVYHGCTWISFMHFPVACYAVPPWHNCSAMSFWNSFGSEEHKIYKQHV